MYYDYALQGIDIQVQGGGKIHAIHVDIQSTNLRVDDLGEIIGDYHTLPCTTGNGIAGTTGSGRECSGPKDMKTFSYLTQLSLKLRLHINIIIVENQRNFQVLLIKARNFCSLIIKCQQ